MLKPINLKNQSFTTNIVQGPLAGFTCSAFRYLTWKYSNPAFTCTEMISCKALCQQPKASLKRYLAKHPKEGPLCVQLFGSNPQELAHATKIVTDLGADLIDLNCGCPVRKVRSQGAGSSLLTNPAKIADLIQAMRNNTHLPISIKIRVDGVSQDKHNIDLAQMINNSELDFVTVHGRHWTENYGAQIHYDQIQYFVETLKIPVIGNGNVACAASLQKMLATGCAGVMIGRAGIGQPWLIGKLAAEIQNQKFILPTSKEIGAAFLEQVSLLINLFDSEKFAIIHARKLASAYARGLSARGEFSAKINCCDNLKDLTIICNEYFV